MCNAYQHPPGCECGFGPPYLAGYGPAEVTEWSEEILKAPGLMQRGLRELAWDEDSIREFADRFAAIRSSELTRETMLTRIRQLLGMRKVVEESVSHDWINVPLYRFGAPSIEGAVVEYSESAGATEGGGWNVKVFGIGTGNTTSIQVARAKTYVATSGTCKLVYIPIMLRVAKVAVYERSRLIGRGVRAEVAPLSEAGDEHLRRRGCRSVATRLTYEGPADYIETVDWLLSDDTSGAVHHDERRWESDTAREVSAQLVHHVNVSALVSVQRTRRLELTFALPAGHDYLAHLCPGVTWWEAPRPLP